MGTSPLPVFDTDVEKRMWVKGKFTGYNISNSKLARGGGTEALQVTN